MGKPGQSKEQCCLREAKEMKSEARSLIVEGVGQAYNKSKIKYTLP
jgi:hypothetical protein